MSKTLVIPSVSAGNIPQLVMDLLIHSLGATFVQSLSDKFLYPFAGPVDSVTDSAGRSSRITTAIEVYSVPETSISLIQLRSPTLPGFKTRFITDVLIPYINEHQFTDVIVLGSSNAAFVGSSTLPDFSVAKVTALQRLKVFSEKPLSDRLAGLSLTRAPTPPELPESGIVLDVLRNSGRAPDATVSAIVVFAYEGDNFRDAEWFADEFILVLGLEKPKEWLHPRSWNGVYGKKVPIGMEEGIFA